jgi:hypothetical protein
METRAYQISGSADFFPQHCQVSFLMWNQHLQGVIDELVTTFQEMPPEKQTCVLMLVAKKLSADQLQDPKRSLMHPGYKWILPQRNLQLAPFVPPPEQRVPKQRVPEQRVTLEEGITKPEKVGIKLN